MISKVLAFTSLLAAARAQQVGTLTTETHPALSVSQCTASGCTTSSQSIVVDANWRWLHSTTGSTNCYTGNTWDKTLCPDGVTCAANCALDGADYSGVYGITTSGNSLKLNFVTKGANTNVGSRTYLMAAGSTTQYQLLKLLNQEFTFDVDVSNLPCGLNGALYFSAMDADGGLSRFPTNKAGAKYGTGYCDAQCPQDIKFINGVANSVGWTPSSNDVNAGAGQYGSCCTEMDIWEANKISAAYTPHPCSVDAQTRCTGTDCGIGARYSSLCDADGCDFNSYRQGNTSFYGPGLKVDTSKVFTVVTQFITNDGTASGTLKEIRRFYVQNGVVVPNSQSTIAGVPGNSITDSFCAAQKTAFGDTNEFAIKGGLATMSKALAKGMVLVMSIWDDHTANMLWLDAPYPPTKSPSAAGVTRGSCSATSGSPVDVEANSPGSSVTFSNIKWGPINSTYTGGSGSVPTVPGTTTSSSAPASTPTSGAGVAKYGQCGGTGWTGATACVSGTTCVVVNPYYYQCQ
ncbi:putative cellobiohydrolase i-i protein [Botrytis fragariae]|uniref:Glucanase n=1 Tax=Botrytis fragariae TaxID=1964551 RepID=A0A8H6AKB8_9HELO|nr:putative cellobiohydrolase i-i protein [Botrytis fragariae]KAF5869037.1 putative cellobiohydrolase i-i protein [Botrytis fragariae]